MKWALIGLALLAACGGGTSSAAQPSPTPNLGAEYTRIVKPINDADDVLYAATQAKPQDNPRVRNAAAAAQVAYGKFNADLLALEAKALASIRTDIDAERKGVAAQEQLIGAIVTATDLNLVAAVNAASNFSDGGAASLVRADLGLAPPPNSSASP
jgi:hypothetical protein